MDREVQEPLALMDEIERELGMSVVPFTWPVGMGKRFHGVMDLREEQMRVFEARRGPQAATTTRSSPASTTRPTPSASATQYDARARTSIELLRDAAPPFDRGAFLAGKQTPMFFGSAINNFGVREVLDALVDLAPPPGAARRDRSATVAPDEPKFTGVVFKIQANMDPAHRDRIAFVRVASGHFERGMRLKVVRSGKELRPNTVVSFLSQRRELLDEAYAGDIIGIPNHGVLQLGDTLTEGEALQFTGLPFFAPEMFRTRRGRRPAAHQAAARRPDAARRGRRDPGVPPGRAARCCCSARSASCSSRSSRTGSSTSTASRRASCRAASRSRAGSPASRRTAATKELQRFIDANQHRVAYDAVDAPTVLVEYAPELRAIESNWPKIRFHALREHAGLVFQKQLEG